jgi:hypothetical protein
MGRSIDILLYSRRNQAHSVVLFKPQLQEDDHGSGSY